MSAFLEAGERLAQAWLQWMWPMAWQVAAMGAVILGVGLMARKRSPRFLYVLWALVLLKLCLPPTLSFVTGVGQWALPEHAVTAPVAVAARPVVEAMPPARAREISEVSPAAMSASALTSIPVASTSAVTSRPAQPGDSISWRPIVLGVWLIGIAALAALFAAEHRRVWRRLSKGKPVEDERIVSLLEEAKSALGVRAKVRLISVADFPSPILTGLLRPCVAIPEHALAALPLEQMRPILLHELAHYRRRDLWMGMLQMVLQTIYWFHPMVWIANAYLRHERELIVDDMVLAHLEDGPRAYSDSLLSILRQGAQRQLFAPAYVGIIETPQRLAGRMRRILDARRKPSLRIGWAGVVLLVALGVVLIPQARSQTGGESASGAPTQVRGRVVDRKGLPVEGARLILYHNKSHWGMGNGVVQETTAAKDGSFGFKEPLKFDKIVANASAQDSYVLLAVHPDHAFAWANIRQGELQESYTLKLSAGRSKAPRR